MSIRPQLAWYFHVGDQKQFLYYAEEPKATFAHGDPKAKWSKIYIETPTRLMDNTKDWIENKSELDIILERRDQIVDKPVLGWKLKKAHVIESYIRRSKIIDMRINFCVVEYEEASHANL